MHNLIVAIIFLCLSACSEKTDYSTPAQSQIDDYSTKLQKCIEEKKLMQASAKDSDNDAVIKDIAHENTAGDAKSSTSQSLRSPPIIENVAKLEPVDGDMIIGDNSHAQVIFIEYFSPTCPHCAYYNKEILPQIKQKYVDTNKITYIVREFIGNKLDLDAAILARCANSKEGFFKFVDVLLAQQDNWSTNKNYRETLTNIGQLGGISAERYQECLSNEKLSAALLANTKLAATSPKFVGTPAFFINGVQFTGRYSVDGISRAIEQALNAGVK